MLATRVLLSCGTLQVNPVRAKCLVVSGLSQICHSKWLNICNTVTFSASRGKMCKWRIFTRSSKTLRRFFLLTAKIASWGVLTLRPTASLGLERQTFLSTLFLELMPEEHFLHGLMQWAVTSLSPNWRGNFTWGEMWPCGGCQHKMGF